jgi:hypothetical protein
MNARDRLSARVLSIRAQLGRSSTAPCRIDRRSLVHWARRAVAQRSLSARFMSKWLLVLDGPTHAGGEKPVSNILSRNVALLRADPLSGPPTCLQIAQRRPNCRDCPCRSVSEVSPNEHPVQTRSFRGDAKVAAAP